MSLENDTWQYFSKLWDDLDESDEFYNRKPHLAHYTSIAGLEKILLSNELWFANPLYMNDHEEVGFGIDQGWRAVKSSEEIANACGSDKRTQLFLQAYERCYWGFANDHVMDTYVFCMSEHEKDNNDGFLSMWRGYGGNGSGAAVVIDAGKIDLTGAASLILAKVRYGTVDERISWLKDKVREFAGLLEGVSLADDQLHVAAVALFERLKSFALFTKHNGFNEEREWRAVYMPNRDAGALIRKFFGYSIGGRSVEPRLRFPLSQAAGIEGLDLSLETIVDRIILGPTVSSRLAVAGFLRLLDSTKHPRLKERVRASGIPYREKP